LRLLLGRGMLLHCCLQVLVMLLHCWQSDRAAGNPRLAPHWCCSGRLQEPEMLRQCLLQVLVMLLHCWLSGWAARHQQLDRQWCCCHPLLGQGRLLHC
jgi:hypothetical protein